MAVAVQKGPWLTVDCVLSCINGDRAVFWKAWTQVIQLFWFLQWTALPLVEKKTTTTRPYVHAGGWQMKGMKRERGGIHHENKTCNIKTSHHKKWCMLWEPGKNWNWKPPKRAVCTQIACAANTRKGFPSRQHDGAMGWTSTLLRHGPMENILCQIYLNFTFAKVGTKVDEKRLKWKSMTLLKWARKPNFTGLLKVSNYGDRSRVINMYA